MTASRTPLPDSSASEPSGLKIRRRGHEAALLGPPTAAGSRRRRTPGVRARRERWIRSGVSSNGRFGLLDDRRSRCRAPATSRSARRGTLWRVIKGGAAPLCNPPGASICSISAATSAGSRPVTSICLDARDLAHPGELAPRVVAAALASSSSTSPASSSSKPSALRAVCDAPAASAARTSSAAPAATIASTRASIRSYSAARSMVRPHSSVGWRVSDDHSSLSSPGARRAQRQVSQARRAGRGPCRRPRSAVAAGRQRGVDLGVGQRHVLPGRELVG